MSEQAPSREELRRRLRAKCGRARSSGGANHPKEELAQRLRQDPTGALLSMGVDDPDVLRALPALVGNKDLLKATAKSYRASAHSASAKASPAASGALPAQEDTAGCDDDDEEMPPEVMQC